MNNINPIVEVTPASFDSHVRRSALPVLIAVFNGEDDGMVIPLAAFEEVALSNRKKIASARIHLNVHPEFVGQLGITATPALLLYHSGEVHHQFIGQWSRADVASIVTRAAGLKPSISDQDSKPMNTDTSGSRFERQNGTPSQQSRPENLRLNSKSRTVTTIRRQLKNKYHHVIDIINKTDSINP